MFEFDTKIQTCFVGAKWHRKGPNILDAIIILVSSEKVILTLLLSKNIKTQEDFVCHRRKFRKRRARRENVCSLKKRIKENY